MKPITRTLVQCTTKEDAGRIEEVLLDRGFKLDKGDLVSMWEENRENTAINLNQPYVGVGGMAYYNEFSKGYFSQYNHLSAESFLSLYDPSSRRNRFNGHLRDFGKFLLWFFIISLFVALSAVILDMLPVWVTIAIVVAIIAYLSYGIIVR